MYNAHYSTRIQFITSTFFLRPMNLKFLEVLVSGLDYMNDDPSEVNVLYAKVKSPEIQMLADKIQTFFKDCGK